MANVDLTCMRIYLFHVLDVNKTATMTPLAQLALLSLLSLLAFPCTAAFTIIVVGPTGSGKSTLVNRLLNSAAAEVSHRQQSCTQRVESYELKIKNHVVELIDTPGFPDTASPEQGIANYDRIVEEINGRRPSVILFLVKYGRWARENDILETYAVIMNHFKSYGWYVVLGTSWAAVDVQDEYIDAEFTTWQKSMHSTMQQRFRMVHNVAAFGKHRHARKELLRIIGARLLMADTDTVNIPSVSAKLEHIYNDTVQHVRENSIGALVQQARTKQHTLKTTERLAFWSLLSSLVVPVLLPFGAPLLGIMSMTASLAAWSGFNVFSTYFTEGRWARDALIQAECQHIEAATSNVSKIFTAAVDSYLLQLQEITGVHSIDYRALFALMDADGKPVVVKLNRIQRMFAQSCAEIVSDFRNETI